MKWMEDSDSDFECLPVFSVMILDTWCRLAYLEKSAWEDLIFLMHQRPLRIIDLRQREGF